MPEDDEILKYCYDGENTIEPEVYYPIIPMILVNGALGIGTGWSTFIPKYNPIEIINNIKQYLDHKTLSTIHPWYKGFKGTFTEIEY
jgi:DNA topoisomerase-2